MITVKETKNGAVSHKLFYRVSFNGTGFVTIFICVNQINEKMYLLEACVSPNGSALPVPIFKFAFFIH